jgi:DNA-binding transcriptional LysR family regulator
LNNVRSVAAFVNVVNAGSFTAAAANLGVTPAAVSKSVQNLERELGIRLLNRSTRRLALTEEGEFFFERARAAMLDLDNAVSAVMESKREPMGLLRVTSAITFGRSKLLPLISEFMRRYPKVTLNITLEDRFADMLVESYDVSIRVDLRPLENVVARSVSPIQAVVCGTPSYFRTHPMPRVPKDLLDHNCIRFRSVGSRKVLGWEFERGGKIFEQQVHGTLILSDSDAICTAVVDGSGLGQIPGYLAAPYVKAGQLKPVLVGYLSQSRNVYVCYSAQKYVSPRIRAFIDFVMEKLGGNPELLVNLAPTKAIRRAHA